MPKILVISQTTKLSKVLHELMPEAQPICAHSIHEAQDRLRQQIFDLCIIQVPLPDEFGIRSAKQWALKFTMGILLLVKKDIYDQTIYPVQEEGIFVLSLPCQKEMLYQALRCLQANCDRIKRISLKLQKMNKQIQDEKLIYQAKLTLISQYCWSEEKAHHYIEKAAMDSNQTRAYVARSILKKKLSD